ncbi:DUF429 domain-containing protein [archaeon]|nr:DUF429 domain-containing protein [archaeon]
MRLPPLSFSVVGIDLTGTSTRASSIAHILGRRAALHRVREDRAVIEVVERCAPRVVAIDAPLTLPEKGVIRQVDRMMLQRGYRVLPPLIRSMQSLTLRGIRLKQQFQERGIEVIEVHPTSSAKALGARDKQTLLRRMLSGYELSTSWQSLSRDDLDALLAAITAAFYVRGEFEEVRAEDGVIVLPRPR